MFGDSMNGRLLFLLCFFLGASFGAFGQLSEPTRWKLKQRGITKFDISFQQYYASDVKLGWKKGKASEGPYVEKSSSKQKMSLNWNTPNGTIFRIEGEDKRKFYLDNRLMVKSEPIEWISRSIDTTKNYHHFDATVSASKKLIARIHISVQPSMDILSPSPIWGFVEFVSGRTVNIDREIVSGRNFLQIIHPSSVWKFSDGEILLAEYKYHYKRPKFSVNTVLTEQELDEFTAVMSVLSVWIKNVYMMGSDI